MKGMKATTHLFSQSSNNIVRESAIILVDSKCWPQTVTERQ